MGITNRIHGIPQTLRVGAHGVEHLTVAATKHGAGKVILNITKPLLAGFALIRTAFYESNRAAGAKTWCERFKAWQMLGPPHTYFLPPKGVQVREKLSGS
ncbi:hypothetical protein GCM10009537_01690 [Corynebacterium riegelii]